MNSIRLQLKKLCSLGIIGFLGLINLADVSAQVALTSTGGTTTATYTSINEAFAGINNGLHTGAIILNITANTSEPATITPLVSSGTGNASYTSVLIRPQGGSFTVTTVAARAAGKGLIELNGADYVTIDGDPNNTGNRQLTFEMPTSTTANTVIRISSKETNGNDGATFNTIKNCNIIGGRTAVTNTTANHAITFNHSTSTSLTTTGGYASNNNIIENNHIQRAYVGIYLKGNSSALSLNNVIRKNIIGSTLGAFAIGQRGIYLQYASNATNPLIIEENDISIGDTSILGTGFSSTISGLEIAAGNAGAIIQRNNFHDIYQPTTSGWGAYGINASSATNNNGILIKNNFFRDIVASKYVATKTSSFVAYAFYTAIGITDLKFNHNTIALLKTPATGTVADYASGGVIINSSSATISEFYGNSIHINFASSNAYALYLNAASIITNAGMNYNNYYVPSIAYVAHTSSSNAHRLLSDFQTATGKDSNSINELPPYISNTDIHISSSTPTLLESGGPPIALLNNTTDYDNQTRPGPTAVNGGGISTDIGADEFDGIMVSCLAPIQVRTTTVTANQITFKWDPPATTPLNGYSYYFSTSATPPSFTAAPTGTLGNVDSVIITTLQPATTYYFWVRSICSATDSSNWSNQITSTTLCGTVGLPFIQEFSTGTLPECWENYNNNNNTNANTFWKFTGTVDYGTTNNGRANGTFAWIDASTPNAGIREVVLETPEIDATTVPSLELKFDWFKYHSTSTTGNINTAADNNKLIVKVFDGTNWNTVFEDTSNLLRWRTVSIPLNIATYGINNLKIRFIADKNIGTNPDFYDNILLDNIIVQQAPTCYTPMNNVVINTSLTTGTVRFNTAQIIPGIGYEAYLSTSSTAPTTSTTATHTTTDTIFNFNSLTPDTKYYYWIRSACAANDKSLWTTIDSFYTGYCIPPYTSASVTNFENLTTTGGTININKLASGFAPSGYGNYTATDSLVTVSGTSIQNTVTITGGTAGIAVYIDMDNDLDFATSERIYTSAAYVSNSTFSYTIPATLAPGTYRLRYVTDWNSTNPSACSYGSGRGETEDYKLVISCNPISPIDLGANTSICPNDTIVLNPNNTMNGGTYLWSTNETTDSISISNTGTYWVRYTSAQGCIYSDTIVVTATTPPVVNLGNDTTICSGNTLTLDAGNPGATYLWSNNATTQTIPVTTAGTYSVVVANGRCTSSDTIIVNVNQTPIVDLGNDTTICSIDSLVLDAGNSAGTYLWSNNATTNIIVVRNTGTYYVTINNNGCIASDTIEVNTIATPNVNLGNDTTLCDNATLILNATNGNADYLWSNNATTPTITVNTAGTYWVEVENNGCTASDTINIDYSTSPIVNLGADTFACNGSSITLNAGNPGMQYLWNNNSTAQTINVNSSGLYSVIVTNNDGCFGRDEINVNFNIGPAATGIDVSPMTTGQFMFSVNSGTFINNYEWSFGDGDSARVGTIPHQYRQNGTYTVSVKISNECGDTTLYTQVVVEGLSIDDILSSDVINVYPNPTSNILNITLNNLDAKIETIVLYNILGQEVLHDTQIHQSNHKINVSQLAAGVYQMMIITDKGFLFKKIEKVD